MTQLDRALKTADETRAIEYGPGVLERTGEMFARLFPGRRVLVVADGNTFAVAGDEVVKSLLDAGAQLAAAPLVFPGTPTLYADYGNVGIVRERLAALPDAVACSIASGSLNDITKLASGELGRPHMNVCTAASVDGFSAYGAAISIDGFKITRECRAPAGLVADLDIMAAAPARLTSTGYGDLIEKIPAGADWILADELGIEPIEEHVWTLVHGELGEALGDPEAIARGERDAVAKLAEANLLSGLAMQAIRSSRPASGAVTSSPTRGRWRAMASTGSHRSATATRWAWGPSPPAPCGRRRSGSTSKPSTSTRLSRRPAPRPTCTPPSSGCCPSASTRRHGRGRWPSTSKARCSASG